MKSEAKRLWRLVTGVESVGSEDARLLVGVRAFCVPRGLVVVLLHVCDLNVTFGFEVVVLRLERTLGCCALPWASDSVIVLELPPAISDARLVIVRSIVARGEQIPDGRFGEALEEESHETGLCHRYTQQSSRSLFVAAQCRARSARS